MVDKGDDEKFKGFKHVHKSLSKCVFWVDLYVGVVDLHFMKEYSNYWNSEELRQSIEVTWWIMLMKVVVLCKTCETIIRGIYMCCFPVFMFCQVEGWCQEH
jgi:hypothetical protein